MVVQLRLCIYMVLKIYKVKYLNKVEIDVHPASQLIYRISAENNIMITFLAKASLILVHPDKKLKISSAVSLHFLNSAILFFYFCPFRVFWWSQAARYFFLAVLAPFFAPFPVNMT